MLRKTIGATAIAAGAAVIGARVLQRHGEQNASQHQSETESSYRNARRRILILGAGFGGMTAALELDRRIGRSPDTSILVVDRFNSTLFTPLLWTVADGRSNANGVVVPVRSFQRRRSFHILHADIERIDLDAREVHTGSGVRPYDVLVIALGSTTATPDLPGLRELSLPFHTPADALELRNHLIDAVEAAHNEEDPDLSREWLTFVVAGGGDTGIELAATIHGYVTTGLYAEYPWLRDEPLRVVVVGRADRLVPMSDERTSSDVRRTLEAEGVEVLTGVSVLGVTDLCVQTSAGDIPARTLFWAAGITAPDVVHDVQAEHAGNGAIVVDEYLRVKGRPEVYVIGDSAWASDPNTGAGVPPTAQAAEHQGRYVGRSVQAADEGKPIKPFKFSPKGHLALLGRRTGVARIGPFTVTGLPAWLMWHGYYWSHLPSWRNRIYLATDWALVALTGRETGQLRLGRGPADTQADSNTG
ncbi:MAG: NAD(P)/FAD-dependent oxidoreductase [Chloroflexia bacterium]